MRASHHVRIAAPLLALTVVLPAFTAALDDKEIERLVKQLGDDAFAKREGASKRVAEIGEPALDALRQATSSDDLEVRRRAQSLSAASDRNRASRGGAAWKKIVVTVLRGGNLSCWSRSRGLGGVHLGKVRL